jgi:pimeloyl-ACP methyl ester carboxylesterase
VKRTLPAFTIVLLCAGLLFPLRAEFKPEIKYAQVGDVKLAYYTRGEGEPLLMINGFLSTMSLWDPLMIEELAKQHQLILFDNRGVGLSTDTKENHTTIPQMADDAAGLLKALGIKKANILAYSMGARIGQQFLIRHPDLVSKAVLCAADPGGKYQDPAAPDVEAKLNSPDTPKMEKLALTAPDTEAGRAALKAALERMKAAVAAGIMPDDFDVPKQTIERQDRARTTLWNADNSNFENLKNVKVPVLITDGRSDEIDPPKNSLIIANQIPFSWLAFFEGGHSFLYTSPKHFADTVNAFLQ